MLEVNDITVYPGAPNTPRDKDEENVYRFLEKTGVSYLRAEHAPADTMEDCAVIEKVLDARIPKNLWLCNRQKTDFYLLIMPPDKPFHTKDITEPLGCSRLSFAPEDPLWEYLHIRPGAVSPLGLIYDLDHHVRLVLDQDLLTYDRLAFHPCRNHATVRMTRLDFVDRVLPALGHEPTWITF
jgi:Ala-tRNA(Pro) deacylase